MSLFIRSSIAFFILIFSGVVIAQQAIAVIDIERAAIQSNYAKSSIKKLQESDTFKKNLDLYKRLGGEFKALQNDGKTNGLTWSDEQKAAHTSKLEKKLAEINKVGGQLDSEKAAVERRIQKELTPKIEKIVPEIIKDKKLGLLLNSRAVYFRTPEYDITQELTDRLNKLNTK